MFLQRTLKDEVSLKGVGLHSGNLTQVVLKPAPPNTGIVFIRTDLKEKPEIPAHYLNIVNTQLATTLGKGKITLSTVEHILAACYGLHVDNAWIEVNGPEIPVMDGSAAPFCEAIASVGTEMQLLSRPCLAVRRKIELKLGEKWAVVEPSSCLEIHGSIEWDHPAVGYQEYHYQEGKTSFNELAQARTFGFLHDVEALKKMGLARGGSLENAVVLDHSRVLNPEGLRCSDEFIKHKILDALGDFKLAGFEIHAYFRLHRAGHDLHYRLLSEIFSNPDHFEIIDATEQEESFVAKVQAMLARSLVASL